MLSSVLREARQLRALRAQLLNTAQPDGATALRAVENENRELGELRAFEAPSAPPSAAPTAASSRASSRRDRSRTSGSASSRASTTPPGRPRRREENDGADADAPPAPAAGAELQAVVRRCRAPISRARAARLLRLRNGLLAAASSESPRRASGESGGEASRREAARRSR